MSVLEETVVHLRAFERVVLDADQVVDNVVRNRVLARHGDLRNAAVLPTDEIEDFPWGTMSAATSPEKGHGPDRTRQAFVCGVPKLESVAQTADSTTRASSHRSSSPSNSHSNLEH